MAIPKNTIETIRQLARIEQIIARYVPTLTKRGNNFVGLCPFHKEKTPSFTVSPDKQIFHCFGCHEGGNVFSFIQKIENMNFPQSVEHVAGIVGYHLEKEHDPKEEKRSRDKRILKFASKIFNKNLNSGTNDGLSYIMNRGLTRDAIDSFELGFAPESWDFIKNSLKKRGISEKEGAEVGLLKYNREKDRYYDAYRNRVIFPISDVAGDVVGFGGRIIGDGEPKYINSPESDFFKKRHLLYGFDKAVGEIKELDRAIIVEGYLDVIGCHQAGISNVVAPLGTALTLEQLTLLSRYCSEIILLFDSDSAGEKAALRSLEFESELNVTMKIASLPEGDPFDFIQDKGVRHLLAVIDSAFDPVEFRLRKEFEAQKNSDPRRVEVALFKIVESLNYESERLRALELSAELLGMFKDTIRLDFEKYSKKVPQTGVVKKEHTQKKSFLDRSIEGLIQLLICYPELIEKAQIDFAEISNISPFLKGFLIKLFDVYDEDSELTTDKLFDFFTKSEEKTYLSRITSISLALEHPESTYTEIFINIKIHDIDKKIEHFTNLLRHSKNEQERSQFLAEIDIWRREKEKLSSYLYSKNSEANGRGIIAKQ